MLRDEIDRKIIGKVAIKAFRKNYRLRIFCYEHFLCVCEGNWVNWLRELG